MEARSFVLRGALAGAVGGVVAWLFALVFAEPQVEAAIAYEEGRGAAEEALATAAGAPPAGGAEEEIVSRGVQATIGIGVGMVGIGIAAGLLFAVAYTLLHGRVALRPRVLALVVAGAGFLTLYATPFVTYPANPPAVGSDETIGDRTALYRVTETPLPLRDPSGAIVFPGFDPDVLYDFRLASFAAQALLWGVLGLVFGGLVERRLEECAARM